MLRAVWEFATSRPVRWMSAVVVALLGIYGTFVYERKPDLVFEVTANSSVLDVRETLSKLVIVYDGRNLKAENQNLYLLTLRVANRGGADIVKSSYDESEPLGFRVTVGTILEQPSIAGEDYLKNNLRATVRDSKTVTFSPVILNAGDAFEARTLLLVSGKEVPTVSPIGKVAGVRELRITEPFRDSSDKSYAQEAFGGRSLIQLGRLALYAVVALLMIVIGVAAIAIPSAWIGDKLKKGRRRRMASQYRNAVKRSLSLKEEYLLNKYIEGSRIYRVFRAVVVGEIDIEQEIDYVMTAARHSAAGGALVETAKSRTDSTYRELESVGLIVRDGPQVAISPDFEGQARELVVFLTSSPRRDN